MNLTRVTCVSVFAALIAVPVSFAGTSFPAQPGETVVPNQYIAKVTSGAGVTPIAYALPGASVFPLRGDLMLVVTGDLSAMGKLAQQNGVDFVEPNRVRAVTGLAPNDPSFGSQWALQTLQAQQAWSLVPGRFLTASSTGNPRVHVAVLDTGIDCSHPDFANAGSGSSDSAQGGQINFALSRAFVTSTMAGSCGAWQDDFGHGTGTAGIIAAAAENGTGVVGVGYPLDLVIYKVMDNTGSASDATIATAIMAAADAGAHVVSLSLGGAGYSHTLQTAINYAWAHDTIIVGAAGNSGSSGLFYPADASFALGVSATDSNNNRASFSNYGSYIGLGAPGVNVLTTFPTYTSPIGATNYAGFTGTSAATPHVAAVAGLLLMETPNTSAAAIMQRLQQSASSSNANGGWTQDNGYGVVNAYNAVSGTLRPAGWGGVKGQIVGTSGYPIYNAQVSLNGNTITTDGSGLFHFVNLSPGTYPITVNAASYAGLSLTATVAPGADTEMDLVLGGNYGSYSGVVSDGGAGVPGAIVQALSGGLVQATAVADPSGNYTLWVAVAGTYDIRATQVSRQTSIVPGQFVSGGGNTGVNLTLSKMPVVSGTVVDSSSHGVANAQLSFIGGGTSAGASTDSNGNYSTAGLPPGSYTITATASGQPETTSSISISSGTNALNIRMGGNAPPPAVSIAVTPSNVMLNPGQTIQFTASVQNASNTAVSWSLSSQVGSVDSTGFYRAPTLIRSNQKVTIAATSVQDTSKTATATITVNAPPPTGTVTSMSVGPAGSLISAGATQQFTANVNGSPSNAVIWSISPPLGGMSPSGLYTAPNTVVLKQLVTVTASSTAATYSTSTYLILLPGSAPASPQPPPPPAVTISVSPSTATVASGGSQLFSAQVGNTANTQVTWSVPSGIGSIDAGGTYHAPSVTSAQTVTIVATSAADTSKSASATVTVNPPAAPPPPPPPPANVSVSIAPYAVFIHRGQTQQFTATVTGTSNSAVRWNVSPSRGTISQSGLYAAPTDGSGLELITLTATSLVSTNVSTSIAIFIMP